MTKFNLKAALAATLATSFLAAPAMAQETGDFQANAEIIKPLTMTITDSMEFGGITLLPSLTGPETVSVYWDAVAGAAARTCGANLSCGGIPLVPDVAFTGGVGSQSIDISYDPPATLDYVVGAGPTAVTYTLPFQLDTPQTTLTLSAAGAGSFKVNGSVTVSPTSVEGTYSGTVDVEADYN